MTAHAGRLSILTSAEIDELFGLPRFSEEDRGYYFELSAPEQDAVTGIRTASVAVHFVLQCGYFKAKRRFFVYEREAALDDLSFIVQRYFPDRDLDTVKPLSKPTRLLQQQSILQLFGYRPCDGAAKEQLEAKMRCAAMLSTQPVYLLREALRYLTNERVVAPGYSFLQDLVGRVVASERQRLTAALGQVLTATTKAQLDALLTADEGMYRISVLKHQPKDFSYGELRQEVERRKFFQPLYEFAREFLVTSGVSNESVKYYASLVQFYTVYKLQRMAAPAARLYLLCFAYHRYRQINDILIEAFIHLLGQYESAAKSWANEAVQEARVQASEQLSAAGRVLDLFVDESIPDDVSFASVKYAAFSMLDPSSFPLVSAYMRNADFDKAGYEWAYYATLSPTFKRNLRHLFIHLDVSGRVQDAPLLDAVCFLQELLREGKSPRQVKWRTFQLAVIPKSLQRYLLLSVEGSREKQLDADRYEFIVYRLLRNALEAGDVYVQDSNEFRRFEDDLISDERWDNRETVLREVDAPILLAPIEETLAAFREAIEAKFKRVNERINDGENLHIKVKGDGEKRRWTLVYPGEDEALDNPFYGQLPSISIADLLWFVAGRAGFLRGFTHVLDRYVKHEPDPEEILACIVALGTNMGAWKMAEVSGLSHSSLLTTARNYLRLETLHAANDAISNLTASLPIFHHLYDIRDTLHSSSDGQRIETQIDTVNARHSPKYFGLHKGVSAYTLVANHVPINAKVIGTHEHESHYVFDLLYNNTTDVKPGKHSTDSHGTNQVNFWILYAFGLQFAPRYRNLHKKMDTLVAFRHPSQYPADSLVKPARKALDALIIKEWPNIQRIMASLAQKDVTQATIVRKLSSYARQNQTKKALWELENICRTLYILEFIDDVTLRQSVQKALNRGEAYHRLRRAIAYVNSGKLRVKTEAEQQIWNECCRLIANAIVCYNTLLLSKVYELKQAANNRDAMEVLAGVSPVAWRHVNLYGRFEFSPSAPRVDIEALAARYEDPVCWENALQEEPTDALGLG